MEGEELQVIEDGDVEDWLKVAAFPLFFSPNKILIKYSEMLLFSLVVQ